MGPWQYSSGMIATAGLLALANSFQEQQAVAAGVAVGAAVASNNEAVANSTNNDQRL